MRDMVGEEISFMEEILFTKEISSTEELPLIEEIPFMEVIQSNHSNLNHFRSEYLSDNAIDSNHNIGNELGNKKLGLDNFEDLE